MNLATINYLNIGFMILASIVAFVLPFELALLSYVILGPIHYLTEIPWLKKRQFFMPGKKDYLWLALLTVMIIVPTLFKTTYKLVAEKSSEGIITYPEYIQLFMRRAGTLSRVAAVLAMASSVVFVLIKDSYKRIVVIGLVFCWVYLFRTSAIMFTLFILSLSLTHVYFFTGMFILAGALKSRSVSGALSLVAFALCTVVVTTTPFYPHSAPGKYVIDNYNISFYPTAVKVFGLLGHKNAAHNDVYFTQTGVNIARFIGFAYFYHYLNWFSKTSIIGWHKVSRKTIFTIVGIWMFSISLYLIDFTLGLAVQFFLSVLHVILEYPLNFQSFRDVSKNFRSLSFKQKISAKSDKTIAETA